MTTGTRPPTHRLRASVDVARRAFDTAAALTQVETLADLDLLMRRSLDVTGFSSVSLSEIRGNRMEIIAGEPARAWWPHFLANGYARYDAVCKELLRSPMPFFWSELVARGGLTPMQTRIMEERRACGIHEGFSCPTFHRDGTVTATSFVGGELDARDTDLRAAVHMLASGYGVAARRIGFASAAPVLTARQIDCLTRAREGKSGADIGAILGISVHTVQEHITGACARLGVRTRVQAVAEALAMHLIPA